VIDRRSLLLGSCGGILATASPVLVASPAHTLHAAARRAKDGTYSAAIFTSDGRDVRAVALPERGHDITVCAVTRRCVAFARRPGNFAIAFSGDRTEAPITFTTVADRHFYGHGVFSRDGRLLYATENDFEGARGIIGIYDATAAFRRIGEFATHGVGPHDLPLLREQSVLVIANGGLREHPDIGRGRRVLNPGAIETSIAYIDLRNGELLELHRLGKPGRLSLRHLDVGRDDIVVVGAQVDGPAHQGHALIYKHRRQEMLRTLIFPNDLAARMAGYVSSVAVDKSGDVAAITSSRGSLVSLIDIASGDLLRTQPCTDTSGVSATSAPREFLITSGRGTVATVSQEEGLHMAVASPWEWDNHAVIVS